MCHTRALIRAALALLFIVAPASPVWAGAPTEELRGYVDRAVAVLEDPDLKPAARNAERRRAMRVIADEGFDFRQSARRALGPHCQARTPSEQARFVELFTSLIDLGYLSRVKNYDVEKAAYDEELVTGNDAHVEARVIAKDGDITPVIFHLARGTDNHWRVYDAAFEGVSLVDNYRAQFQKLMRAGSYSDLLSRLEAHVRAARAKD
jgi:phospholipid transport system substrate-binding protein